MTRIWSPWWPNLAAKRAALIVAVSVLAVGCGESAQPGSPSGQFAGERDGLGAMVDFLGADETAERMRSSLTGTGRQVALAYIVNRDERPVPLPTFTGELFDGRLIVFARADQDRVLRSIGLPVTTVVPGNGALTIYLTYRGNPAGITRIGMRRGIEREVTLVPQRGDGSQPRAAGG